MKMQAPAGCRQVSHAGVLYRVEDDGAVEVPEAARDELEAHGFVLAAAPVPAVAPVRLRRRRE